jgi:hypothetical protein
MMNYFSSTVGMSFTNDTPTTDKPGINLTPTTYEPGTNDTPTTDQPGNNDTPSFRYVLVFFSFVLVMMNYFSSTVGMSLVPGSST